MMSPLIKARKIYIAAPAGAATGGPELLHQLAVKLRDRNLEVVMIYHPAVENPVHRNYLQYNIPYTYAIEDDRCNALIVPETLILMFKSVAKAQKIVWWLSFDNYLMSYVRSQRFRDFILDHNLHLKGTWFVQKMMSQLSFHLTQSAYAKIMLEKAGITNAAYLTDYLHKSFLKESVELLDKKNIVAYNPGKGKKFTKKIIQYCSDINFVPIENMTREEVVSLLKCARVYIDFGNHPGRDRIPREAAILHCCVLTNKRGSAGFFQDMPIPGYYKFDESEHNLESVKNTIRDCFENYEARDIDFDTYRAEIAMQETVFEQEVAAIFALNDQ